MSTLIPIPKWQDLDKPREKLASLGPKYLSDSELLALIIGSGSKNESAVDLARKIIARSDNGLKGLAQFDKSTFLSIKGIGEAKASQLLALLELSSRLDNTTQLKKVGIQSSSLAFNFMKAEFSNQTYESFHVLLLDRANKVIRKAKVSEGGVFETTVDPIRIFKTALNHCATGIILFHNHPSGNLSPSKADISLTKRLVEGGKLLNISVLDHLIIGAGKYFSFRDEGLMPGAHM